MKEAAEDLREKILPRHRPHGDSCSSSTFLKSSLTMAALAAEMVEQLQSGASGLAKEQRELGDETVRQKAEAKN